MKIGKSIPFLFIFVSVCFISHGQSYDRFELYVNELVEANQFSGNILLAKGDKIVFEKAFGPASIKENSPNEINSQFQIGSITKTYTAAAVMRLMEEGKLNLNDPLSNYLALFPKAEQITIEDLLSHRSGIKNYTERSDIGEWMYSEQTPIEVIEKVLDDPFLFEPGSLHSYSNTNYVLLGIIIEQITGLSYEEYLTKVVLNPLDLRETGFDYRNAANLSEGFIGADDGWYESRTDLLR